MKLWDSIVEFEKAKNAANTAELKEPTIIFLGTEGAGKTTLLSSFIYKSRPNDVRSTVGLDYKYTRTATITEGLSFQLAKLVCHFWEIGGGRQLSSSLSTLLTNETAIFCVIDLSKVGRVLSFF